MNREIKRRMRKEQAASADRVTRAQRPPAPGRRDRVKTRQFIREIQGELRRVAWPTRSEVMTYATVVLIVVLIITGVVFALDFGFAQGAFMLFRPAEVPVGP